MRSRVSAIARTPRLLLAVDFDGTLAPIVAHPDDARGEPRAMDLLRRALALPQTAVAIVSGRALGDLRARVGPLGDAWFVGGHGAEMAGPELEETSTDHSVLLEAMAESLRRIAPAEAGYLHERKPGSIAVHYRAVEPSEADAVVKRIIAEVAKPAEMPVRHGKKVVELLAADVNKGNALGRLRESFGSTGTFYMGDDVTDEDAFAVLGPTDLAVKVGEPPTEADLCVGTLEEAHALLEELIECRSRWLGAGEPDAIEDHSILSDQRTIAVVRPDASIVWLCVPRVDSSAIFASLLDGERAGSWSVGPADRAEPLGQRYVGDSFLLETSWPSMRVTDYMDCAGGRTVQRAGRTDLIRVLEGHGRARVVFCPRLDFGRARTKLVPIDNGVLVEGGADPIVLVSHGVQWTMQDVQGVQRAVAEIELTGEPVVLELRAGTRSTGAAGMTEAQRREQTGHVWGDWIASLRLPSIASVACRRSALVLRALSYGPTGAVLAAATTSLPESPGGCRNWDYRFCWPRDAAVACSALVRLGDTGVAMHYLDWLLAIVDRCAGPERLRPIYSVTGRELGAEAELTHLSGYRSSQPVRIGNAAAQQVQLDVFGPIVDLVHRLAAAGAAISPDHWRLVEAMALAVERSWREPDHGIWEVRTDKRQHVHSKAMCWLALDRAVKLADRFVGVRREAWARLRDEIRDDVLKNGFDAGLGGFVAAYDVHEADAAALTLGLCGLVDPKDERFVGTVDLVCSRLTRDGTVLRYVYEDGIAGPEGGFHLATGWLVESLLLIGRQEQAERLFEQMCKTLGPTGLLSEQWCPNEQTGMGNIAQAYSHAALISAALALSGKERR